jgi:hypothetical protein
VVKEQQRFKAAVERKSRDAEAASRASHQDEEGAVQGDQEGLCGPSQRQDSFSADDRNTRRKKVAADRWNR